MEKECEVKIKVYDEERLEKLGLIQASKIVKEMKEVKRKMAIAYEHFRFVRPEKIVEFNEKLRQETLKEGKGYKDYKSLVFIPLEIYTEVPPVDVLDKIEAAVKFNCFDKFEVAKIESVHVIEDPIVFGIINRCADKFFIAQWDDDVKIEQILAENEG